MTLEEFRSMVLSIQDDVIISRIKFGVNMYDPKTVGYDMRCEYCGGDWGDHVGIRCGKRREDALSGRQWSEKWPINVYTMAPDYPHIDKLVERYNKIFDIFGVPEESMELRSRSLFATKDMTEPIEQMRDFIAKMQKGS